MPSLKASSAHQLEAIIEAALLPDTFKNARTTLSAMHPMAPIDGFTNEVRLYELDPESASQVRDVLNAGATIGAVREPTSHGHYLVRAELHTFLSDIIKSELKRRPEETERGLGLDRLEKRIREALMPYVLDTSEPSCNTCIRSTRTVGFTSEIFLNEVDQQHLRPVRNLLTAGSSLRVVARDKNDSSATTCTPISTRRLRASGRASWRWKDVVVGPSKAARSGRQPSPTHVPGNCSFPTLVAANPASAPRPRTSCGSKFQEYHDRGAGTDARRAAQGRGAGNRGSGSERRRWH